MKGILLFLLFAGTLFNLDETRITGKVTDNDTGEALIGANIALSKNGAIVAGSVTDFDGNYQLTVDPGTYDVDVTYFGYQPNQIQQVIVKAGQDNKLDIQLLSGETGIQLEEIIVTSYKVPLISPDNTTQGSTVRSNEIQNFATKNIESVASSTAGLSQSGKNKEVTVRGSHNNRHNISVDGIRLNAPQPKTTKKDNKAATSGNPMPAAGQLTAGEWKDLDNWTFWKKLMEDRTFAQYRTYWGFHPDHRFELKLSDDKGRPLPNVVARLRNKTNEILWSTITDNHGSACLWGNFFSGVEEDFHIEVILPEDNKTIPAIPYTEGLNSLQLMVDCRSTNQVDLAFVVDVSASMNDEIQYLRAEIKDVIERAETEEDPLTVRTAAVYYSGQDEKQFLNRSSLTENENETLAFLENSPLGGGNLEAVHLGLDKAVNELDWNPKAIARIVFVLLDEPPATDENTKKAIHRVVREAAAKGIKVIPVAASGTNKPTEFLLKFFAMGTNSTYTFLTDHSGIGDKHMAPEAGAYNVENLNDLMVRLIIENSASYKCDDKGISVKKTARQQKISRKARRSKGNRQFANQIKHYPNPATNFVNISMQTDIDLLVVTSSGGKVIGQYPRLKEGEIRLNSNNWTPGAYFLHFHKEGLHVIRKLVVQARD